MSKVLFITSVDKDVKVVSRATGIVSKKSLLVGLDMEIDNRRSMTKKSGQNYVPS